MSGDSFTDLRLNRQEGQIQESFWPSFTDIMTTVVMIFLIAMVVLLVRNMELVNQLRSTMEAERIAAELARATGEEKDSLAVALHTAEEQMQQLRLEIMRLEERGIERETLITEQLSAIADLTNERDDLTQRAAQLMLLRKQLEADVANQKAKLRTATQALQNRDQELQNRQQELSATRSDMQNLQANLDSLQDSLAAAQRLSSELADELAEKRQELEANRQMAQDVERKYLLLVGDYDNLKVKYDKLVRPARSATGRHLVEVRYWKSNGEFMISWREGSEGEFQAIKRERLEAVLTRLAREKQNGLYVRVIFPENAGLSYNEAWEFTSQMHKNYDYYFRDDITNQDNP
jgi:chromosome segregation ATPase